MSEQKVDYKTNRANKPQVVKCIHCKETMGVFLASGDLIIGNLLTRKVSGKCLGCGKWFAWKIKQDPLEGIDNDAPINPFGIQAMQIPPPNPKERPEPSKQEIKQAKRRIEKLEILAPYCHFESTSPSQETQYLRERYKEFLDAQSEFESKYY